MFTFAFKFFNAREVAIRPSTVAAHLVRFA